MKFQLTLALLDAPREDFDHVVERRLEQVSVHLQIIHILIQN